MEDKTPLTAKEILSQYDPMNAECNILSAMEEYAVQQIASLQERVKELESDKEQLHKVIVGHEETIIERVERIIKLNQLNEKLMGLLENNFRLATKLIPLDHPYVDEAWQTYRQENGI